MTDTHTQKMDIRTAEHFQDHFNVSRETLECLQRYAGLLSVWQKRINLVSGSTLDDIWQRHLADSAQLYFAIRDYYHSLSEPDACYDLGSGAGFPGLVFGILAAGDHASQQNCPPILLVESSAKKCAFLRDVIHKTNAHAKVVNKRIESCLQISNSVNTRLIMARALASLDRLLHFAEPVWKEETKACFLKGNRFRDEIVEAQMHWDFAFNEISSLTNQDSVILEISDLRRKEIEE